MVVILTNLGVWVLFQLTQQRTMKYIEPEEILPFLGSNSFLPAPFLHKPLSWQAGVLGASRALLYNGKVAVVLLGAG
jgi:hypothetical protein